jgi:thiamine biosynthesis lipoprotein
VRAYNAAMTSVDSATAPPPPSQPRRFARRLIGAVLVVALFAWLALRTPGGGDERVVSREFESLGTLMSVSVYLQGTQTRAQADAALDDVEAQLRDYTTRWSAWGEGELGTLNRRLVAGEAVTIPEVLQPLFSTAATRYRLSGGRFDVRIGRLVELWGFDDEAHYRSQPPPADAIAQAVAALAAAPALDEPPLQYGPAPGVRFDFGALAKGDAVDRIVESLRARGFADVIVNAGGNLRAAGQRGDRPWRIGIRHPRPDEEHRLLATLDIEYDEAVVTSGDYERYFESGGRRYHHILDPGRGQPASALRSVTVVTREAVMADGSTTALFVAGDDWPAVAGRLGLDRVLVVDAQGRVAATPALARRLRYADGIDADVVPVVAPP